MWWTIVLCVCLLTAVTAGSLKMKYDDENMAKTIAIEKAGVDAVYDDDIEKRMHTPATPPKPHKQKYSEHIPTAPAGCLAMAIGKTTDRFQQVAPGKTPITNDAYVDGTLIDPDNTEASNGNTSLEESSNGHGNGDGSSNGKGGASSNGTGNGGGSSNENGNGGGSSNENGNGGGSSNGNGNSWKRDVNTEGVRKRSMAWPELFGFYFSNAAPSHPAGELRPGIASEGWSCDWVRPIPQWLRQEMYSKHGNVSTYYSKYTEAYSIPIMGSAEVTDTGLMRACYTVAVMLASRVDIRNSIYKWYIRISLIPDYVFEIDLPERNPCPVEDCGPNGPRGLGPTTESPVCSAGDDNMRCTGSDRFYDQNILIHEFAHAIDLFGASKVIPGFDDRLSNVYYQSVVIGGMWNNTYASENPREFFACATQFYFNAWRYPPIEYEMVDQASLRDYDPVMTELLDDIFPCQKELNIFLDSCHYTWACNTSRLEYEEVYPKSANQKSTCPVMFSSNTIYSIAKCAEMACVYGEVFFQHKNGKCRVVSCATLNITDLSLKTVKNGWNIYTVTKTPLDMTEEMEELRVLEKSCTKGKHSPGSEMCNVTGTRTPCFNGTCEGDTQERCEYNCNRLGCCWQGEKCYYPIQVCADSDTFLCTYAAGQGECDTNPAFMYKYCPFTCNICEDLLALGLDNLNTFHDYLSTLCQDHYFYCAYWQLIGECGNNPEFMHMFCPIQCGNCTSPPDPLVTF